MYLIEATGLRVRRFFLCGVKKRCRAHRAFAPRWSASRHHNHQEFSMPTVRLRVTGTDDAALTLIHALEAIEGIEHVEEIEDLMPHMDDDDSSSAGLSDDAAPGYSVIEVEAPNEEGVRRVHEVVERVAISTDSAIEILNDEDDQI
jgi:hypothetical protein